MGQAPFGCRTADDMRVYSLGEWVRLGSGSLNDIGDVLTLYGHPDE